MTNRTTRVEANRTAQHLKDRITKTGGNDGSFMRALTAELSSRLRVCAATGQIEDHINNFFMRFIARDALRVRLENNEKITDRELISYAVRSSFNDIRGDGTEPVTREFYQASTETERKKQVRRGTLSDSRLVYDHHDVDNEDTHNFSSQARWVDLRDDHSSATAAALEDRVAFGELWEKVERRSRYCEIWQRHGQRLLQRAEGLTHQEIGKIEGLPVQKVLDQCAVARASISRLFKRDKGLFGLNAPAGRLSAPDVTTLAWPTPATTRPVSAPTGAQVWIFQANPKYYRIVDALAALEELAFYVNRYKADIKVGDTVLLWVAGKAAGIYAKARVVSEVQVRAGDSTDQYQVTAAVDPTPKAQVLLKIEQRFITQPVLKTHLLDVPTLRNLMVVKQPNGTNFRVTAEQWAELSPLLPN